jgi:hypothetical protein
MGGKAVEHALKVGRAPGETANTDAIGSVFITLQEKYFVR